MEQGNYGYSTGGYTISGLDRLKNTSGTLHIGDAPKAGRKWNRITPEGLRWLTDNFAELKNADLAAHLGISESNIHRLAQKHGLTKSAEMLARTHKEVAKKALATKAANGTMQPKGILPEGFKKATCRLKKGQNLLGTLSPERQREARKKARQKRMETLQRERRRVLYGFEQRTRLRVVVQPKAKCCLRSNMKCKFGYIPDKGNPNVIYYDENTVRRPVMEDHIRKFGVEVKPLE